MKRDIIISWVSLLTITALLLTACNQKSPEPTYQARGIAAIPAQSGIVTKELDTVYIRTVPVIRYVQVTSDSTYTETRKYVKPTTPPPVVVDPPVSGYELVFQSGFDKMTDLTTNSAQSARGTISTTNYVTGPGSFYSIPDNVSSGTRSEVQYTYDYQNPAEGAIEYDVYYEVFVPSGGHSLQSHPNTPGGSASPGLWHIGGTNVTLMRWRKGSNTPGKTWSMDQKKWVKIRLEYKFAQSNAYYRIYKNGVLMDEMKPTSSSWFGDGSGGYWKIGYNGWDANSKNSRIYYDNLKIYKKI